MLPGLRRELIATLCQRSKLSNSTWHVVWTPNVSIYWVCPLILNLRARQRVKRSFNVALVWSREYLWCCWLAEEMEPVVYKMLYVLSHALICQCSCYLLQDAISGSI